MNKLEFVVASLFIFFAGWMVAPNQAFGHSELTPQILQEYQSSGTLEERKGRIATLKQFRMAEGTEQRAVYKVRRAALEASGQSLAETARTLTGGPTMAFPYTAQPELRSKGTVKTLTVLVDFKDHRAASRFPNLQTTAIRDNIYGVGTAVAQASFKPHESVHEYYRRASQDQVNIQGSVLGWQNFAKDRKQYEPVKAPSNLTAKQRREQQAFNDNTAIFRMLSEALTSVDATHDFAQYDNDGDGDIDLVTILYAGPATGWGSFWWAYRWEFFSPEALTKKFDGKRVKQFVFQFVETRGPNGSDYNPTTLLHEMGHAFGLADYYDYDSNVGPQGGVGGLDMMHANKGNQNAFSRWLLDWIKPTVVGSGGPALRTLNASGSKLTSDKAIAIFPGLANGEAPGQEMFIIENRHRIGNDESLPSNGLVIWHIDASVTSDGVGFEFDNSFTDRKLIRLLRADSPNDFNDGESASSSTYFTDGKVLTPSSSPNSKDYAGRDTQINVDQIGAPGETVTLRIGFITGMPPLPAVTSPAAASSQALTSAPQAAMPPVSSPPSLDALLVGRVPLDLDVLESLDDAFAVASAATLAGYWSSARIDDAAVSHPETRAAVLKLLAARWASKDGAGSVNAVEQLAPDDRLRTEILPLVLKSWAKSAPSEAIQWYVDDKRRALRATLGITAAPFTREAFAGSYAISQAQALKSIQRLESPAQIAAAVDGVVFAGSRLGQNHGVVTGKLYQLPSNMVKARVDVIRGMREAELKMKEPLQRSELERLMRMPPQR